MIKILLIVIALLMFLSLQGCQPMFYIAKDFSGNVVDADTGMPVEGVVVVAEWIPYEVGLGDGGHKSVMEVRETITDKNGKYTVIGWGPRLRNPFRYLDSEDPALFLFKKGYQYESLDNGDIEHMYRYYGKEYLDKMDFDKFKTATGFESNRIVRTSIWNGRTIKMRKFNGDCEKLYYNISSVDRDVLSKWERGIPFDKVKHTVKEWNDAVNELNTYDCSIFKLTPIK